MSYFNSLESESVSHTVPPTQITTPNPGKLPKLDLIEIDAQSLKYAAEILSEYFSQKGQFMLGHFIGNEFRAVNTHVLFDIASWFKFNVENGHWAYDSYFYEEREKPGQPGYISYPDNYENRQFQNLHGEGLISFIAYMYRWTAQHAASELKSWLDDLHPDHFLSPTRHSDTNALFDFERLKYPDYQVLICSNIHAAYAARFLLPGFFCTTVSGDASFDKMDFSLLKDKTVYLWPDHGDAGKQWVKGAADRLFNNDVNAEVIKLKPLMYLPELSKTNYPEFKIRTEPLPDGYNASDAFAEGWTSDMFYEVLGKLMYEVQYKFEEKKVGSFVVKEDGVYAVRFKDGEDSECKIASRVEVTALTRDEQNQNWGMLLKFPDRDGNMHEWAMPKEMLAGRDEYRQVLLERGADLYPASYSKFSDYLLEANPTARALCVNAIGWHGSVFVLPAKSYGKSAERVILQTANARKVSPYAVKGTLAEWQHNIGSKCVCNSRIILATCVALSGPFIEALEIDNGGFHFRGESSTGKTKTLTIGGSIWGGKAMIRLWKATGNAVESLAREHSDTVLLLDELGQVDPKQAGDIAYTLGNGQAKARANVNGDARAIANWRILFLSTGEIGLADHVASGGGTIRAGQEIRMLDIPSDSGAGMGVFEDIHGAANPVEFSNSLQRLSETYYGSAADALLNKLTEPGEMERAVAFIKQRQSQFVQQYVPANSHGQISRAASRFAAVAGVGEYCISIGILPWEVGHAMWGTRVCYSAWLESRGDTSASEDIRALAQVRSVLERDGESRFTLITPDGVIENNIGQRTINRIGFRVIQDDASTEFWILTEMYKQVVCNGFDSKLVTRVMKDKGYLELDSSGKTSVSKLVPGLGRMRVYVIKATFMQEQQ